MRKDRFSNVDDSSRLDLRAIDPDIDPRATKQFVSAVMSRIANSPVLPAIPLDPLYGLWSIPPAFLVAASILIIATLGVQRERINIERPATVAEAVGVPVDYLAARVPHP